MAVKKIEEILSHFDKRQFSPVYLLTGEENYYIDLLTSKFEEEILDEAERDFNLTTLYGLETNAKEICSFAIDGDLVVARVFMYLGEANETFFYI